MAVNNVEQGEESNPDSVENAAQVSNSTANAPSVLQQLIKARENAVPLYMNGNFKVF